MKREPLMAVDDGLWDIAANRHRIPERPLPPKPAVHEAAKMPLVSRIVFMSAAAFSDLRPTDILQVTIVVNGE